MSLRAKKFLLLLGDIALFFSSLALVIILRYPNNFSVNFSLHLTPFSIILPLWLIIFYIAGLYEPKVLKNGFSFLRTLLASIAINTALTIIFLYATPIFGITPRINLVLFLAIFFSVEIIWRQIFNTLIYRQSYNYVLLIGRGTASTQIEEHITNNPQLGYRLTKIFPINELNDYLSAIENTIINKKINTVVIPQHLKKNLLLIKKLYKKLSLDLEVFSTDAFYEHIFQKVPLSEIQATWFLENIVKPRKQYQIIKRIIEIFLSAFLLMILSPVFLLVSLTIILTSEGQAIYQQTRLGKNERTFTLYKFRSMVKNAESNGAEWSRPNDHRVTKIGSLLRSSHLDELPQLWNIFKGDLSFVGPRPERPEFINQLNELIPFYEIRHLITPGITGWAQINYRYGASTEDAYEKLQYELYYLKNRSLLLDTAIMIKTIKTFFVTPK